MIIASTKCIVIFSSNNGEINAKNKILVLINNNVVLKTLYICKIDLCFLLISNISKVILYILSFSDNTVFQHSTQRLIQYQHQNKIADSVDHIKRDSRHPPCKCSMDSPDKQIGNRAHRSESKTERFLPFYSSNIIYFI